MMNPRTLKSLCCITIFWFAAAALSSAQTFTVLHNFAGTDGMSPQPQLTQGLNGDLFGTAVYGGLAGDGVVFGLSTSGTVDSLYSFNGNNGNQPFSPVALGLDGNLYGTTNYGGAQNLGTFFTVTNNQITPLHRFLYSDGTPAQGGVTLGSDGNFYGATLGGGAYRYDGTVYQITTAGVLTVLHSFSGGDGAGSYSRLVEGPDGYFYGTTFTNGQYGEGTIFKINSSGTFVNLHNFCSAGDPCPDGYNPTAGLNIGSDGNLYGATARGGTSACSYGGYDGCGVIYSITPGGHLTVLHDFVGTDGIQPLSPPIQATDGNFYGVTVYGGANGAGTIYMMTPSGTLTTLYNFCSQPACADGSTPVGSLTQDTNGILYGLAAVGGTSNDGILYSLDVGLGPFVTTMPSVGSVGRGIRILGTNLTGATSVTFNGTAATFTVISGSQIKTTVPAGATTGPVQVVTPSGTLTSNVNFTVR
jgi:uncharacterized repeat protein (TIGR03803 family)